jgi:Trypsin-like peptidase domain
MWQLLLLYIARHKSPDANQKFDRKVIYRKRQMKSIILISSIAAFAGPVLADDAKLYEIVSPSVIKLVVAGTTPDGQMQELTGTGVVISSEGYALTATHNLFANKNTAEPFVGLPSLSASLAIPFGPYTNVSFEIVDTDITRPGTRDKLTLLKLKSVPGVPYRAAHICKPEGMKPGTAVWAAGFPVGADLALQPGGYFGNNGNGGLWQTGLILAEGYSGGPVTLADGSVVAVVEGALGQGQAGSLVTPVSYGNYKSAGVAFPKCGASNPISQSISSNDWQREYLKSQIDRLYAPLNLKLQWGQAEWDYFLEQFNYKFGRRYVQAYREDIGADGQKKSVPIPLSDAEWSFWIDQVKTKFKPHNDSVADLVEKNISLMDGGQISKCYRDFLWHITAFNDSVRSAENDLSKRTWTPSYSWPSCFVPEVSEKLTELKQQQQQIEMRLQSLNKKR